MDHVFIYDKAFNYIGRKSYSQRLNSYDGIHTCLGHYFTPNASTSGGQAFKFPSNIKGGTFTVSKAFTPIKTFNFDATAEDLQTIVSTKVIGGPLPERPIRFSNPNSLDQVTLNLSGLECDKLKKYDAAVDTKANTLLAKTILPEDEHETTFAVVAPERSISLGNSNKLTFTRERIVNLIESLDLNYQSISSLEDYKASATNDLVAYARYGRYNTCRPSRLPYCVAYMGVSGPEAYKYTSSEWSSTRSIYQGYYQSFSVELPSPQFSIHDFSPINKVSWANSQYVVGVDTFNGNQSHTKFKLKIEPSTAPTSDIPLEASGTLSIILKTPGIFLAYCSEPITSGVTVNLNNGIEEGFDVAKKVKIFPRAQKDSEKFIHIELLGVEKTKNYIEISFQIVFEGGFTIVPRTGSVDYIGYWDCQDDIEKPEGITGQDLEFVSIPEALDPKIYYPNIEPTDVGGSSEEFTFTGTGPPESPETQLTISANITLNQPTIPGNANFIKYSYNLTNLIYITDGFAYGLSNSNIIPTKSPRPSELVEFGNYLLTMQLAPSIGTRAVVGYTYEGVPILKPYSEDFWPSYGIGQSSGNSIWVSNNKAYRFEKDFRNGSLWLFELDIDLNPTLTKVIDAPAANKYFHSVYKKAFARERRSNIYNFYRGLAILGEDGTELAYNADVEYRFARYDQNYIYLFGFYGDYANLVVTIYDYSFKVIDQIMLYQYQSSLTPLVEATKFKGSFNPSGISIGFANSISEIYEDDQYWYIILQGDYR